MRRYTFLVIFLYSTLLLAVNSTDKLHTVRPHYFEISTPSDLNEISALTKKGYTFHNDTLSITKDIVADNYVVGNSFQGTLLGNKHSISNITSPLFISIDNNAKVDGIVISNSTINGNIKCGGISQDCNNSIISNCINKAQITVYYNKQFIIVGGICGNVENSIIAGCENSADIHATMDDNDKNSYVLRCGGIVGWSQNSTIITCTNNASVIASNQTFAISGGIVGDSQNSQIIDCNNKGCITSNIYPTTSAHTGQYTGGVIGLSQGNGSIIDRCKNHGKIQNNTDYVAGIVAYCENTSLYNNINYGDVVSTKYYFYACANGITSNFKGVSDYCDFMNCINYGSISATSNRYTATAGGICYQINNGKIANCHNYGSINASGSNKFIIECYDAQNSIELTSKQISQEKANEFIDTCSLLNSSIKLLKWNIQDDKVLFEYHPTFYSNATQGAAFIQCYSPSTKKFKIVLDTDRPYSIHSLDANSFRLENLIPNTSYKYQIQFDSISSNGLFTTLPVTISASVDSVLFCSAKVSSFVSCADVRIMEYGYKYKTNTDDEWKIAKCDSTFSFVLNNLRDTTQYYSIPFIRISNSPTLIEGNKISFKTKELRPQFVLMENHAEYVSFICENIKDLIGYEIGVKTASNKHIKANNKGVVTCDSLKYGTTYSFIPYIYKNDSYVYYSEKTIQTLMWETIKPVEISSNAALVHFAGYAGHTDDWNGKNYWNYYKKFYVQYRNVLDGDNIDSKEITPLLIDGHADYWKTIFFGSPGIYQYRLKATTDYSKGSSYYYEKYTNWESVTTYNPDVDLVRPHFFNINCTKLNDNINLNVVVLNGEEIIDSICLKYKIDISPSFNTSTLSKTEGAKQYTFKNLVYGFDYLAYFAVYCHNSLSPSICHTYNSNVIKFNSLGEFSMIEDSELTDIKQVTSSYIDKTKPINVCVYTITGQLLLKRTCIDYIDFNINDFDYHTPLIIKITQRDKALTIKKLNK